MKIDPGELPLPKKPYRGILAFRLLDWRIFLERDAETDRLANLVSLYRGVLLYGQSGSGKSSLVNAGLIPDALRRGRAPERIRVFPDPGRELSVERIQLHEEDGVPTSQPQRFLPSRFTDTDSDERVALSSAEFLEKLRAPSDFGVPMLIFDQFEELVTLFEENPKVREKFDAARAARLAIEKLLCDLLLHESLPLKIVFAFRDDYLARLTPILSRVPNLMDQGVRLGPPQIEAVQRIVRGPFVASEDGIHGLPGYFQHELNNELAVKIEEGIRERRPSGILNLSELQTICLSLWQQPARRDDLLRTTAPAGVLEKIIESEAQAALKALTPLDRIRVLAILSNLVTQEGTRDVVSEENLVQETRRMALLRFVPGDLRKLLHAVPEKTGLLRRSLSGGNTYYELASEFLIAWIQKQQQAFRRIAAAFVFGGLLLVALVMGLFAVSFYSQKIEARAAEQRAKDALARAQTAEAAAKQARDKAVVAKEDADGLIIFMQYDLSNTLEKVGRLDMMDAINARVRKYHEGHPPEAGDLDALREKAVALLQQGDLLFAEGRLNDASNQHRAALKIFQELLAQNADSTDYQRNLSISYLKVGDVQSAQGDLAGALKSYRDSLAITEKLTKQDPSNADWQHDLLAGYERIGDVQSAQGDLAGALKSYRDSLAITEKLTKQDPSNAEWQRNLSAGYVRVGDVQSDQGDLAGALKSYRDSLAIAEKDTKQDPSNAEYQRNLSVSYERIGDVQSAQGDLAGALKSYRDNLAIAEKLAKQDLGNAGWQRDLSVSYNKVGDAQSTQGDLAGALKSYRDSLAIAEKLTNQDPSNAEYQRNLSISYQKVGDAQSTQGDLAGALKSYRDDHAIAEKLAKQDPGNAVWQTDLSISYQKIGYVQENQEDFAAAAETYRTSLSIIEKLARQDPANAQWQGGLGWNCWAIGRTLIKAQPKLKADARAMVEKGREILRQLKERTGLTADQQRWLDGCDADLGAMQKASPGAKRLRNR